MARNPRPPQSRSGPETVKITDVALAAGVAPMTVSRVINTPDRVSAATAARVRSAIESLGYVPNLIAGGLSSRRSRMIAAIVPTIASPIFSTPIQVFTDTLGRAGYHVMLALAGYGRDDEESLVRAMLSRRPDGLLLTGATHTQGVMRLLRNAAVPVVEIWDSSDTPTDMLVGFDHTEVGAAVADFLLARGHRAFAVLVASDIRATRRRDGFVARVAAAGARLIAEHRLPSPALVSDARRGMREIAPLLTPGAALFAGSDLIAFGAVSEARALGIAIPQALAVCGFGDFDLSQGSEPPITTVSVDGAAMGRIAAENLIARLTDDTPPRRVLVPFRIIPRATT
jgi:LacI family gluconate utilization system Gnt-I transcriptional repressor